MKTLLITALLLTTSLAYGALDQPDETMTFDAAEQTDAGATEYKPTLIAINWEKSRITIRLREKKPKIAGKPDYSGKSFIVFYDGQEAVDLIKALNTMDFSPPSASLFKKVINKLITDGKINAGTASTD
jgi:hypothetical protein